MSLRKQVRSKKYMNEVFTLLELGKKSRYGRQEFDELGQVIDKKYVGSIGTAKAIDDAISNLEPLIWTITLQLNGGECLECGNAEGGEGFAVATGTSQETIYDVMESLFGNLDKEDTDGWEYSYDEAGEEIVGEEDTIDVSDDITLWVQWIPA